jgi:hypothetical protein
MRRRGGFYISSPRFNREREGPAAKRWEGEGPQRNVQPSSLQEDATLIHHPG